MSDENVRLALRIHDEVNDKYRTMLGNTIKQIYQADILGSVTAVTCSDLIFVHVAHTLSMALRKLSRRHKREEVE
jgi:hypothetical protein